MLLSITCTFHKWSISPGSFKVASCNQFSLKWPFNMEGMIVVTLKCLTKADLFCLEYSIFIKISCLQIYVCTISIIAIAHFQTNDQYSSAGYKHDDSMWWQNSVKKFFFKQIRSKQGFIKQIKLQLYCHWIDTDSLIYSTVIKKTNEIATFMSKSVNQLV